MSPQRTELDTFFFDGGAGQLFGCYHPPVSRRARRTGVVVCGSVGEEYISFHRALRQLAALLSEKGFPVLRFDPSSTGDSGGACGEGRFELWERDVDAAIDELTRRSGVTGLALVGLRLGGALAYSAGVRWGNIGSLALWDPVVDGDAYVDELADLYRDMLDYAHVDVGKRTEGPAAASLWGLPASGATWASVRAVDLSKLGGVPARHVLGVETNERSSCSSLLRRLEGDGVRVTRANIPSQELWTWLEDFAKVSVPLAVVRTIVGWLDEVSQ